MKNHDIFKKTAQFLKQFNGNGQFNDRVVTPSPDPAVLKSHIGRGNSTHCGSEPHWVSSIILLLCILQFLVLRLSEQLSEMGARMKFLRNFSNYITVLNQVEATQQQQQTRHLHRLTVTFDWLMRFGSNLEARGVLMSSIHPCERTLYNHETVE